MNNFVDFAFLDSGTGGIPYMLALKQKSPSSRCVYLGDSKHFPYGEKSSEQIIECSSNTISKIIDNWQPRTIVIACNTISVTALDVLRQRFPKVPIVGTVPAIKLAATVTKNKRIGFLATNAAVSHPYSAKLIADYAFNCKVFSRADPELISFIEHKFFNATKEERLQAVQGAVDFFANNNCDTIILGCTHFTHIANEFKTVAGNSVQIVDSRDGVANQALIVEKKDFVVNKTICSKPLPPDMSFFVTGECSASDAQEYKSLCKNFSIPYGGIV